MDTATDRVGRHHTTPQGALRPAYELAKRDEIRKAATERVHWTDPVRTARYYAHHCLALLAALEHAERELAREKAGWSAADDLG